MRNVARRVFLKAASRTGLTVAAGAAAGRSGMAQTATSRVVIDTARKIAPVSHELFGTFLEQPGRAIYQGIYDPGSKLADEHGFRFCRSQVSDAAGDRKPEGWIAHDDSIAGAVIFSLVPCPVTES
jgi:hypothetical protein